MLQGTYLWHPNQVCRMSSYSGIAQLKALCVFSAVIDTLRELVQEILSELRFLSLDFESRKAASLLCSVASVQQKNLDFFS